jgi:hypothetical protein
VLVVIQKVVKLKVVSQLDRYTVDFSRSFAIVGRRELG